MGCDSIFRQRGDPVINRSKRISCLWQKSLKFTALDVVRTVIYITINRPFARLFQRLGRHLGPACVLLRAESLHDVGKDSLAKRHIVFCLRRFQPWPLSHTPFIVLVLIPARDRSHQTFFVSPLAHRRRTVIFLSCILRYP